MENKFTEEQNNYETPETPVILSSDDEEEEATKNNYQIVVYDPTSNGPLDPEPIQSFQPRNPNPNPTPGPQKVLPSIGTFTVQCAKCYKWRLIPSKEKYEEIREHILEQPFSCEFAKQWRPDISCDVVGDIQQDDGRLWAIDKPNIAQPPPGWERELRIRGEGSSKFADVYYISPAGKRLRSMVEVQRYLLEHPEFMTEGVSLSQFSFRIPKPMREDYVRKRTAPKPIQTIAADPISWVAPDDAANLQLVQPTFSDEFVTPPARKKSRPSTMPTNTSNPLQHIPRKFKINGPNLPPNGVCDL